MPNYPSHQTAHGERALRFAPCPAAPLSGGRAAERGAEEKVAGLSRGTGGVVLHTVGLLCCVVYAQCLECSLCVIQ